MKIIYVLDRPTLGGGVKIVFLHACILQDLGHQVAIIGNGPAPKWIRGNYLDYSASFTLPFNPDLVIATFWTTFAIAKRLGIPANVHFCQGYEASYPDYYSQSGAIEHAYRTHPIDTWCVAPHVAQQVQDLYKRKVTLIPPVIDSNFRPKRFFSKRLQPPFWVVILGIFEAKVRNLRVALDAVRYLRKMGLDIRLRRISTFPLSDEERHIIEPDEYLFKVPPRIVARAIRKSHLLLFTSHPSEGFGLPVLEAIASKVPVIASHIPSLEYMTQDTIPLVAPNDSQEMADAAYQLLTNPEQYHRVKEDAHQAIQRFEPSEVAVLLENALTNLKR